MSVRTISFTPKLGSKLPACWAIELNWKTQIRGGTEKADHFMT